MEPFRLRSWKLPAPNDAARFYSCARPGRSKSKTDAVPDDLVNKWVNGIPGPNTVLISILGRKPDGMSEFAFYSFCGAFESAEERRHKLSFQEWLDREHKEAGILVIEHPTCDHRRILPETLSAVSADIVRFALEGRTVVLVDSGGEVRSGEVCRHLKASEVGG